MFFFGSEMGSGTMTFNGLYTEKIASSSVKVKGSSKTSFSVRIITKLIHSKDYPEIYKYCETFSKLSKDY